jgi:hypothetical protein
MEFGCFVEVDGFRQKVEGLVHVSNITTARAASAKGLVERGQEVRAARLGSGPETGTAAPPAPGGRARPRVAAARAARALGQLEPEQAGGKGGQAHDTGPCTRPASHRSGRQRPLLAG